MALLKQFTVFKPGYLLLFLAINTLLFTSCDSTDTVSIQDMLVEYAPEPVGVDVEKPRFSWKISSSERDIQQTSYRIIVSDNRGDANSKKGGIWDSGEIRGDETLNIEFAGGKLMSNTTYFWRVAATLNSGKTVWSDVQFFHTGIFNENEWKAGWISTPHENMDHAPYFRKSFSLKNKVEQAVVYVSAAGYYELHINGVKIGDQVLDPAITDYRKTILYSSFDITKQVKNGDNAIAAILGNGAWGMRRTEGRWTWWGVNEPMGKPALFVQLMITYTDGSKETIGTGADWKTALSPITYNDIYGGENYDARKEIPGWSDPAFDDSRWEHAAAAVSPGGKLKAQLMPPIKVTNTIEPITVVNPEPGVFLYDLGQNIAGWWRIEVEGEEGQVVRVRGAETLSDSLFGEPLTEKSKINFNSLHFSNVWTEYTLKGEEKETYEPRFFYNGFRYLEVTTNDKRNPKHLRLEGRVVRSSMEQTGMFTSSDSLLNWVHRAGIWAQKGNLHGYPTDCPHREKGAYNGDGQVIAETSMHDFQMAAFYTKWINDMRDSQEENGRIPNTSPPIVGGMGGGVAWGSAFIQIPWWMYHYYNDKRILEEYYDSMKKYMDYLKELGSNDEDPAEPYIIDDFLSFWYSLGEWCAPATRTGGKSDCPIHGVVNTFYAYFNSRTLSEIATILGKPQDSEYYKALSDTFKIAYNRRYFNPETALYGTEEIFPTYQILPLMGDVVPAEYREKVFRTIVDDIKAHDNHLGTGILGTKYLWSILVNGGENELAYSVATQRTYPSYGYWFDKGATTLLEHWEGRSSHNHQMFGTVTEYFFKFLAGIQSPMEENTGRGYRHIHIEPRVPAGLGSVDASIETLAGKVASNWKKEGNSFIHNVSIPANTIAKIVLHLPVNENVTLFEGSSKIWAGNQFMEGVNGIHTITKEGSKLVLETGSGDYSFTLEY